MSGVFGIIDTKNRGQIKPTLSRMAECLKLREWFKTQLWEDPTDAIGLGQLNIGIFSSEEQPAVSENQAVIAFFFGNLTNKTQLHHKLSQKGISLEKNNETSLVLHLYDQFGISFIKMLQGEFLVCIWDRRQKRLSAANDRLGLYPLYYTYYNGYLIFAPQVKGVIKGPGFAKNLNPSAVADFFWFQRLLEDKTFFEGVHLLPYGSLLSFDLNQNKLSVQHYWDFDHIPEWDSAIGYKDAVKETGRLLRNAVKNATSDGYRNGVFLSGGMDSRTVAALACQQNTPITSITYGLPGCRDVEYARRIARKVGSNHHYFAQPNGKFFLDQTNFHLEITEGHIGYNHGHAGSVLEPARKLVDVCMTGYKGDHFMGVRWLDLSQKIINAPDDSTFLAHLFHDLNQKHTWPGITEAEEKLLYQDTYFPQVQGAAFESIKNSLQPFNRFPPKKRMDYFQVIYQGSRFSNLNNIYQKAYFETSSPFCDYQFVDFITAIPLEYRAADRLYLDVINQEIPEVTLIPRDSNEYLLTNRKIIRETHRLGQRAKHFINRRIAPIFQKTDSAMT